MDIQRLTLTVLLVLALLTPGASTSLEQPAVSPAGAGGLPTHVSAPAVPGRSADTSTFSWRQSTYRDWLDDARAGTALVGDSLAVAATGQFPTGTANITVVVPLDVDGDGDGAADVLLNTTLYRSQLAVPSCVALAYAGFLEATGDDFGDFRILAAFDADGDDDADLVGNQQQAPNAFVDVLYKNDGTGRFSLADAGQLDDFGQRTGAVAVLDADGDGDLDLACGNGNWQSGIPQQNALFLNDGRGSFTRVESGEFNDSSTVTAALVDFDVDGDGDLDLAAGGSGPEALYLNNGHGVFVLAASGDWAASSYNIKDLVAFDADGDGDGDLLPATGGCYPYPTSMLYRNDDHGVFTATDPGDLGRVCFAYTLALLDADGDGDTDVAHGANGIYGGIEDGLWLNNGNGRFSAGPTSVLNLRRETDDVAALDADDDGDMDLVATAGNGGWGYGAVLLLNDGAAHFTLGNAGDFENARGKAITLDADRDSAEDIFAQETLYRNENLFESGSVTSPIINPADLHPEGSLAWWDKLQVQEALASQTDIRYDVLDPATATHCRAMPAYVPMLRARLVWLVSTPDPIPRFKCAPI